MPYAEGRTFLDADSHLMELPDFLARPRRPGPARPPAARSASRRAASWATPCSGSAPTKRHPAERVAELVGLGDGLISGPKGYEALGAFNPSERSQALDQLGFDRQFVFSTFATGAFFPPGTDPELAAGAARAHNRGMAEFCADDERLVGRGRHHARRSRSRRVAELEHIIELGLGAVWVPHRPAGGRSPGHDDLDPFWARLADAGIPAVLHVGGSRAAAGAGVDEHRPAAAHATGWAAARTSAART